VRKLQRTILDVVILVLISAPSQALAWLVSGPVRGLYARPGWWAAFFGTPVLATVFWGMAYAAGRDKRLVPTAGLTAGIIGMLTVPFGLAMQIKTGIDLLLPVLVFGTANTAAALGFAKGKMHVAVRIIVVNGLFFGLFFLQWILGHWLLRETL
jgi:hypothetical protein